MPRIPSSGIGRYLDDRKYIHVLDNRSKFQKAKFFFLPVVTGVTIIFWLINGIKGAIVGFMYGVVAGLFIIHESLQVNKKR
jgi:Mg2+/citrate symporter